MKKILAILVLAAVMARADIGAVDVTTSATQVLPYSPARKWVILQNLSDTDIYVKLDNSSTAVTTSNGIKIAANGGLLSIAATGASNPSRNIITAIHGGTGTKALRYQGGNEN